MKESFVLAEKVVTVNRQEANFDKACEVAYQMAVREFGIDEAGHSSGPHRVDGWERSCCSIGVLFVKYGADGPDNHWYQFRLRAESNADDLQIQT